MLIIDRIAAQGVNPVSGFFSIGFPAVTAFNGAAHMITRRLGALAGEQVDLKGFAIVVHSSRLRVHGKYKSRPTQKRYVHDVDGNPRQYHNHFSPPSEVMPQGDLVFSLALDLELPAGAAGLLQDKSLADSIIEPRMLGGTVASIRGTRWKDTAVDAIRSMGSGWVMVDRSADLIARALDVDPLEALLEILENNTTDGRMPNRRLAPTQTGWRAISDGALRAGSRDMETLHYFAEPVIGMAEFVRKHVALADTSDPDHLIWRPIIDRESGHFYCAAAVIPPERHTADTRTIS